MKITVELDDVKVLKELVETAFYSNDDIFDLYDKNANYCYLTMKEAFGLTKKSMKDLLVKHNALAIFGKRMSALPTKNRSKVLDGNGRYEYAGLLSEVIKEVFSIPVVKNEFKPKWVAAAKKVEAANIKEQIFDAVTVLEKNGYVVTKSKKKA